MSLARLGLVLVLSSIGCGADDDAAEPGPGDPWLGAGSKPPSACAEYSCPEPQAGAEDVTVAVGTGEHCFSDIPEGGGLPIYAGPQGGFHVFVAVRSRGIGPTVLFEQVVRDADSGEVYSLADPIAHVVELCSVGNGWGERARQYNYLKFTSFQFIDQVQALVGRRVEVELTVSDESGASAGATIETELLDLVNWTDSEI